MAKKFRAKDFQKEFLDIFDKLCSTRGAWEVWADFVTMFAIAISNTVDPTQAPKREERYLATIQRYKREEQLLFPRLVAATSDALERNYQQDFLGELYMALNLGNHWKGQFFTPYSLCKAMASVTLEDSIRQIEKRGWVSICDPACGAGATLIGAADILEMRNVNYQTSALFVGQDLDQVAAMMCYIQLSLLGCAGYVAVGNTLTTPLTGTDLFPVSTNGQLDLWYTPMFFSTVWTWRRIAAQMGYAV